ncbi:Protein of unknown function [Gryllus bimaculatus]|nr:Protein of unknown function [Gryllus bimaculatus]
MCYKRWRLRQRMSFAFACFVAINNNLFPGSDHCEALQNPRSSHESLFKCVSENHHLRVFVLLILNMSHYGHQCIILLGKYPQLICYLYQTFRTICGSERILRCFSNTEEDFYKIRNMTNKRDGCKINIDQVKPLNVCVALGRLYDLTLCVHQVNEILKELFIASVDQATQANEASI